MKIVPDMIKCCIFALKQRFILASFVSKAKREMMPQEEMMFLYILIQMTDF